MSILERCSNLFCDGTARKSRKHGRYCSDKCWMDGYSLRRVKALLNKVGVMEFRRLLDEVPVSAISLVTSLLLIRNRSFTLTAVSSLRLIISRIVWVGPARMT